MSYDTNTMQPYPNYPYYQHYPQTPNPNAAALHPTSNAYPQFYQPVIPNPAHMPATYDQYPYQLASPAAAGQQPDRSKHRRNNTVAAVPLKSALKHPSSTSAPPSTSDHQNNGLTRQRTNSTGHNMLARTRTQSNPKPSDHTSGKDPNFVPGMCFFFPFPFFPRAPRFTIC